MCSTLQKHSMAACVCLQESAVARARQRQMVWSSPNWDREHSNDISAGEKHRAFPVSWRKMTVITHSNLTLKSVNKVIKRPWSVISSSGFTYSSHVIPVRFFFLFSVSLPHLSLAVRLNCNVLHNIPRSLNVGKFFRPGRGTLSRKKML